MPNLSHLISHFPALCQPAFRRWLALVCVISSSLAVAQSPPVSISGEGRWVVPLSRLLGGSAPVRMSGDQGELRWSLPVPALWRPREAVLSLEGEASQALISGSQWVLEVNGRVVHQLPLSGSGTQLRVNIAVPVELLKPGFNDVRLRYAQHYTERCEYPMAAQLWSQIDPVSSNWQLSAEPRTVPQRLDQLDALFDKATWDEQATLAVWSSGGTEAPRLQAMGLIAQGVGLRYDFVPVRLTAGRVNPASLAATALPAGARGAVVLGTFDELAPLLQGLAVPRDDGPVLALRAFPGDANRFLLLVAAARIDDLPTAAAAFAMQRMPWPAQPVAALRELQMPPLGSVTGAAARLKPSTKAFPLATLGYRTTTFTGMQSGGATLRFWNSAWQGRVQVRVHASYAAGMSPQSALNVMSNGVLHGSIPFDNPQGGRFDNYAVTVPPGALKPGWNSLQLQPVLVPQRNGGDCQPFFPGNLAATVYEDTTLQTFGGSPLLQPDLGLLANDGRPWPQAPIGLGMAVQLTDADDATLGAGLTLMAKLNQVFSGPLLRTELRVGASATARNSLWVGTLDKLPADVRKAANIDEKGGLQAAVPLIQSVAMPVLEGGDTLSQLREQINAAGSRPDTLVARVHTGPTLGARAVAATKLDGDKPTTVFTAATPAELQAAMHTLVDHAAWSQLRGQLALWDTSQPVRVQTLAFEDAPFVAFSLRGGLGLWVSQYPWISLLLLVMTLLLLGWLSRRLLATYRRRHLPDQSATPKETV